MTPPRHLYELPARPEDARAWLLDVAEHFWTEGRAMRERTDLDAQIRDLLADRLSERGNEARDFALCFPDLRPIR